jgi:hypothetical protein
MKYTKETGITGNTIIVGTADDGTVIYIPVDPANSDYQAYLNKDEAKTL